MLWFAGAEGVFRFDGVGFERVDEIAGNPLLSSNVRALSVFGDALWLGYAFGGVSVFEHGAVRHYGAAEGVPTNTIFQFAKTGDGTLWFASARGIHWLDGARWRQVLPADGLPAGELPFFSVLQDGTLLVLHRAGLYRSVPGTRRFRQVPGPGGLQFIQVTHDGSVLLRKYGEPPLVFDPVAETVAPLALPDLAAAPYSVNRDRRNGWWIGPGDGMQLYDPGLRLKKKLQVPHSFSGVLVYSGPLDDREGNLWFTTENGIDRLRETRLVTLETPPNHIDFSIAPGADGEVWVSSNTSVGERAPRAFAIVADGKRIDSDMPSATSSTRGADGSVWFGNFNTVWRRRDGKVQQWTVTAVQQERAQRVQALAEGPDGRLWVSVTKSGVHTLADGVWQAGGGHAELARRPAISLHADAQGRLWFGYPANQMAMLHDGALRQFGAADGLAVGNVLTMFSRRGTLWVGGDQGVARFDHGRFVMLDDAAGRPFRGVSGIVETAQGELWLHGADGLLRIGAADLARGKADGRYRVDAERFDYLDGHEGAPALVRPLDTLAEAADGRLWYATTSSVGWIDPRRIARNPVAPTPLITWLNTDSQRYRFIDGLELPQHTRNLRVDFTAAVLSIPERARFRTRLVGQDQAWRDAGTLRQAFYTNLGPGDYRFEVMAANEDGLWSEAPATLAFRIAPAFYETGWFKLACAALLAIGLYLLHLRRLSRMTARVVERMRARLDERERIARTLHDTFLQSVHSLTLRFHNIKAVLPKEDPVQQQIDAALDAADAVAEEGRDQLMDLRVSHLCRGDLATELAAVGSAAAAQHGSAFTLHEHGKRRPLQADAQDELFAIGREAIANALRHSGSCEVVAELTYGAAAFTLEVRDEGKGLDAAVRASGGRERHWGLAGMRERAARIGGKLAIHSAAGAGTTVVVALRAGLAYRGPVLSNHEQLLKRVP